MTSLALKPPLRKRENVSYKLFTDKITLSKYITPRVEFKYLTPQKKLHIVSGEISKWNWTDALRRQRSFYSSINRSLRTLRELSEKNSFDYFLTVTFNQSYVDRFSAVAVHKKFKNVMKRLKYTLGGVSYLAVPEYHKDQSIHYHVMCNFKNKPKLQYIKKTNKGNNIYYLMNDFKKEDCFLILEKLKTNNLGYLIKYMTKDGEYPLSRKFSATRDLERSRLVDKILFNKDFDTLKASAVCQGFFSVFDNSTTATYGYTLHSGACAAMDLFKVDIKDENLSAFYYSFIAETLETLQNIRKRFKRHEEIREEEDEMIKAKKLPLGQLSFIAPKTRKNSKMGEWHWN